MVKGPLVYAAVILAAILMILSGLMVLNREFFLANSELILVASGAVAIAVVVVLVLMLLRIRSARL